VIAIADGCMSSKNEYSVVAAFACRHSAGGGQPSGGEGP